MNNITKNHVNYSSSISFVIILQPIDIKKSAFWGLYNMEANAMPFSNIGRYQLIWSVKFLLRLFTAVHHSYLHFHTTGLFPKNVIIISPHFFPKHFMIFIKRHTLHRNQLFIVFFAILSLCKITLSKQIPYETHLGYSHNCALVDMQQIKT